MNDVALTQAIAIVGRWKKGRLSDHLKHILNVAVVCRAYNEEGHGMAMEVVENRVVVDRVVKLVTPQSNKG